MTLLITVIAAVIATAVWYFKDDGSLQISALCFMFWGASLMWFVDGIFCVAEGESFLDLSVSDALLGFVIVISGLVVWVITLLYKDPKHVVKLLFAKN